MHKIFYFLLTFLLLVSCGEDDCCDIAEEDTLINYDGDNFTAPNLPPGDYVFAMRMPTTTLSRLSGQAIKPVQVYMYEIPFDVELVIYNESGNLPSSERYSENITTALTPNSWNTITLATPYTVDGSTLWVGVDINQNNLLQSVGCDQGPANPNGDWLYDSADDQFIRFANRLNESVNWNIRVTLGP